MRLFIRLPKDVAGLAVLAVAGPFAWLYVARDAGEVLEIDVQVSGHPLLELMRVSVDRAAGLVSAGLLGVLGQSNAIAREGVGCESLRPRPTASMARGSCGWRHWAAVAGGTGRQWRAHGCCGRGARMGVAGDTFWLKGHDGQTIAVIPSRRMVVVRMGLTPKMAGYGSELLVAALTMALTPADGQQ